MSEAQKSQLEFSDQMLRIMHGADPVCVHLLPALTALEQLSRTAIAYQIEDFALSSPAYEHALAGAHSHLRHA